MKLVRLDIMRLIETYNRVCVGKYLSDNCLIQNGITQGNALSPRLFISALKYAIGQVGLKLNGTHQLLAYADDMNLLGDNLDTIRKKYRNFT
jgi:hypothetical protein